VIEDVMFDILIYLFETYVHNESNRSIDYDSLTNDLFDIGFQQKDIYNALRWLKNLSSYKKNIISSINLSSNQISTRIYTKEESFKLNVDCRGFILFLEQLEILTLDTREMIIERIMELEINELNLADLKWIILIVLFNVPGCESMYKKLENLLFNFKEEVIH
jgi:Smg protein